MVNPQEGEVVSGWTGQGPHQVWLGFGQAEMVVKGT